MLRLLKNNIFRAVFAGLILILVLSVAFLPRTFADRDMFYYIQYIYGGYYYQEDGSIDVSGILHNDEATKYTSISGHFWFPSVEYITDCTQYSTLDSIEIGADIPADATVVIDNTAGTFSITSDTGIDLAVDDEILRINYNISPQAPSGITCVAWTQLSYSAMVGGNIVDYSDEIEGQGLTRGIEHTVNRYEQNLVYDENEINKTYGDDNFTNPLTAPDPHGSIVYSSNNEAVAKVNPTTGEVQIMGAGVATITAVSPQWYSFIEGSASYTLNVAPKPISITDVSVPDKTYDGTTDTEVGTVTLSKAGLVRDVDYTVSGVLDNANVGTGRRATATVTLIGDAANNYVLNDNTFEVNNITISPYTITSTNIFLEYYATGHDGTEKEPGVTVKIGNFTVDPNEYTVDYADNIDVGTATVTVTAKDGANIASSAQETFEIVDRAVLDITGIPSPQTIIYTGRPVVLEGTLTVGPNTDGIIVDDINIIWYESDGATVISQPTDAGSYMVKYYYSGVNYVGELLVTFTIERAESPEPAEMAELNGSTIRAGKRLSEIEGVRTRGFRWENESTVIGVGRNIYRAIYIYNDDAANYTVRYLDIVIYGESDGGGDDDDEGGDTGGDDAVVDVPDTGHFTSGHSSNVGGLKVEMIVGAVLAVLAMVLLLGGRFAKSKIDFDKK